MRAPLLNKTLMYSNSDSFLAIPKSPVCRVQIRVTPKPRWGLDSSFHASTCAKDERSTIISLLFSSFVFKCRGLPHIQCSPCRQEKVRSPSSQKLLIFFPDEPYLHKKKIVFIRFHPNTHFYTHTHSEQELGFLSLCTEIREISLVRSGSCFFSCFFFCFA